MGIVQKDAFRTMVISYLGLILGYVNKGILFILFLTTEEVGLINLLVSVSLLFGSLSGLGTYFAIWRFFPFLKNKEKRHHGFMMLTVLVGCIGFLIFMTLLLVFQSDILKLYQEKSSLFVHYFYWLLPLGLANVFYMIFDTFLRSMYHNVISVISYELVLRLAITILLGVFGLKLISFDQFLVIHCLIYFIPVVILLVFLWRIGELHLSVKYITVPKRLRKLILQFSLLSYLNSICALFVVTLDSLMIASMIGLKETGVYTTIIYLTSALQIPYKSMIRISAPIVADYWKERNMVQMNNLYKKFSSVNLVIGFGMFLLIWAAREEIFSQLPKDFYTGIYVFLFLMIGKLFDMYTGINGTIFSTSKKYKYDIFFTLFLIVSVVVLNLILIPVYGMVGSAIATGFAYIGYNVGRVLFVWFSYKLSPFEMNQLYVFSIGICTLTLFEFIPVIDVVGDIGSGILKMAGVAILFFLPIYYFKLNKDIVNYIDNGLGFVKRKFLKK